MLYYRNLEVSIQYRHFHCSKAYLEDKAPVLQQAVFSLPLQARNFVDEDYHSLWSIFQHKILSQLKKFRFRSRSSRSPLKFHYRNQVISILYIIRH